MKTFVALAALLLATAGFAADVNPAAAAAPAPISQDALLARQARHDASLFVLDVRTPEEYAQGHVPGAINIPHDQVGQHLKDIPKDKDVVMYCRSGRRVGLAAEVLAANGYRRLLHLEGDMNAWAERSRPLETVAPKR